MFDSAIYLEGLLWIAVLAAGGWVVSVIKRNVHVVDSLWSLFFLIGLASYIAHAPQLSSRTYLVAALVVLWALRLSAYLSWRNYGRPEDRRYQAIRNNNSPFFWLKSLYLVFGLQAVLAWIISLPLLAAATSTAPLGWLDAAGVALWMFGFFWESLADWQLARFRRRQGHEHAVYDGGLWRYCRHPNYFGEFCLWWGFFLIALSTGAWWSALAPLLMSLLLLKVSGVVLLEQDIGKRRPDYTTYMQKTNAFFPAPPRQ
jgi:steroid 5-alpha reductase family enzyme